MSKSFWILWVSHVINKFGGGFYLLTVMWMAYRISDSAWALALLMFVYTLSTSIARMFLSPLVGHIERRTLLIVSGAVQGVLLAVPALLVYSHSFRLWQFYVVVVLVGILSAPYVSTRSAFLKDLVEEPMRDRANAWMQGATEVMFLTGPVIGGVLISAFGGANTLLVNASTFIIAAALITLSHPSPTSTSHTPRVAPQGYWRSLRTGVDTLISHRILGNITLLTMAVIVADTPIRVLIVPYVTHTFHDRAGTVGILQGALSAGILLVTVIIAKFGNLKRPIWAWASVPMFCLATGVMAFAPGVRWAIGLQVVGGLATGLFDIRSLSTFQSLVDTELLAKTLMISEAIATAASALSSLAAGAIANRYGVPPAFWIFGVIGLALGVVALWRLYSVRVAVHNMPLKL